MAFDSLPALPARPARGPHTAARRSVRDPMLALIYLANPRTPLQHRPGVWKKREIDRLGNTEFHHSQNETRSPNTLMQAVGKFEQLGAHRESWNKGRERSSARYYGASSYSTRHRFCAGLLARPVPVFQLVRELLVYRNWSSCRLPDSARKRGCRQLVLSRNSARSLELGRHKRATPTI